MTSAAWSDETWSTKSAVVFWLQKKNSFHRKFGIVLSFHLDTLTHEVKYRRTFFLYFSVPSNHYGCSSLTIFTGLWYIKPCLQLVLDFPSLVRIRTFRPNCSGFGPEFCQKSGFFKKKNRQNNVWNNWLLLAPFERVSQSQFHAVSPGESGFLAAMSSSSSDNVTQSRPFVSPFDHSSVAFFLILCLKV